MKSDVEFVMPSTVWKIKELSIKEKCFVALILNNCIYDDLNTVIAAYLNTGKRAVQNLVSKLVKMGVISTKMVYREDGGVEKRVIKLTPAFLKKYGLL